MAFKICVVGCGSIAGSMHGPSYAKYAAERREAVLAACCDVVAARAETFKTRFGFGRAYTDMEEMLDKERPDAVCLISPVHLTATLAAKILERGIPLLLEKPPGMTGEETLSLMEIAERKGVPNRVAFNRRYAPLVRELKEYLENRFSPSEIQGVAYEMLRVGRTDEDFSTTAIHAIDTARFIAGSDYRRVRFSYRPHEELGGQVADIHMSCEMKSGATVMIAIHPVTGLTAERAQVFLHDHTLMLDYLGNPLCPQGQLTVLHKNQIFRVLPGEMIPGCDQAFVREGFYYENESFFDSIIAGRKPSGDLKTALQSVEVARCIRERGSMWPVKRTKAQPPL